MKMSALIEFLDLLSENGIYAFTNGMIRNIFPGEPEGKRVRKKTLCNLTHLPPHIIDGIRAMLKGATVYKDAREAFPIKRSLPHGHVTAVLATARKLGLDRILQRKGSRVRDIALGTIVTRVVSPGSKLAASRGLSRETANTSLGVVTGLGEVSGNEVLSMLDWLLERQKWIERSLGNRHLGKSTMILYDVTSSCVEGNSCSLSAFGYSRDRKKGKKQVVFGLLCSAQGCPVAVEVFEGNTADPATLGLWVEKIRERFEIENVALVGDRGMLTTARIKQDLEPNDLQWISALRTRDITKLLKIPKGEEKALLVPEELLPDEVGEISSPQFPGERLMVCFNPRLKEQRETKREELVLDTERILEGVRKVVSSGALRGRDRINRRVGREANRRKVEKHFDIRVTDDDISWSRNEEKIRAEGRLDGIYIIRTGIGEKHLGAEQAVEAYKGLCRVERAFRSMKSSLRVRPIYAYSEAHVRGHVFLCMLAYYVEWHMRKLLAPLLFEDDDREGARRKRRTPVERAVVSDSAKRKSDTKKTSEGLCVHSFATLMEDLGTLSLNEVTPPGSPDHLFCVMSEPTAVQRKALGLLGVDQGEIVPSTMTG